METRSCILVRTDAALPYCSSRNGALLRIPRCKRRVFSAWGNESNRGVHRQRPDRPATFDAAVNERCLRARDVRPFPMASPMTVREVDPIFSHLISSYLIMSRLTESESPASPASLIRLRLGVR